MSYPKYAKKWDWTQVRDWTNHQNYEFGVSSQRMVTRSQVAFHVIENSLGDLELFADPVKHKPPRMPPLMVTMKKGYGSIPNTVITRSFFEFLKPDQTLRKDLEIYKRFEPTEEQYQKKRTYKKRKN